MPYNCPVSISKCFKSFIYVRYMSMSCICIRSLRFNTTVQCPLKCFKWLQIEKRNTPLDIGITFKCFRTRITSWYLYIYMYLVSWMPCPSVSNQCIINSFSVSFIFVKFWTVQSSQTAIGIDPTTKDEENRLILILNWLNPCMRTMMMI